MNLTLIIHCRSDKVTLHLVVVVNVAFYQMF